LLTSYRFGKKFLGKYVKSRTIFCYEGLWTADNSDRLYPIYKISSEKFIR